MDETFPGVYAMFSRPTRKLSVLSEVRRPEEKAKRTRRVLPAGKNPRKAVELYGRGYFNPRMRNMSRVNPAVSGQVRLWVIGNGWW